MNKLDIYTFGKQLLETGDLDPVYIILWNAKLEDWMLQRWLLAYWCFYSCGTASWITEGGIGYWDRMGLAAASKDYPRGSERRHFRGENSRKSVEWLRNRGLEYLFKPLVGVDVALVDIMAYVKTWEGFGPWIAFKVADMVERLGLSKVRFDKAAMFLFDSPREGAELLYETERGVKPVNDQVQQWAVDSILLHLENFKAPPRYERLINPQEAETILCKWKSYMNGHYHVGKDIHEIREGLLRFAKCKTSQKLLQAGKVGKLW